ncbi:MAG: AAA family ATPase, partial [Chromatiaceae bacterium]
MIILRIKAECLHRYRRLRLTDLPERGIIALSGDNESGKSGIGEIICFALFGRTFSLAEDRIGKLVHWGAGEGAVTLRFRVKGRNYEVSRHLARDGEQSARLILVDAPDGPLARATGVTEAITRLLGYGFDDYIETFYLAQREIGSPHPHSPAVRAMVGAASLEECASGLGEEIRQTEATLASLLKQQGNLTDELGRISPEPGRVQALEINLAEIAEREARLSARLPALQTASDEYSQAYRRLGSHGARRALAGLFSNIALLAVLAVGTIWGLLRFQPETWPIPVLLTWLEGLIAETGLTPHTVVLAVEVVLGGLLLLFWLWLALLALGMRRRRSRA